MTFHEIVTKGKSFADELAAKLSDPNETTATKQVFFMDNHERIQKIMGALNQVVSNITTAATSPTGIVSEEDEENLEEAKKIVNSMKATITDFQKSLTIDENVDDEGAPTALTEESIADAMEHNKGAQRLVEGLEAVSSLKNVPYNYALCVDGKMTLLSANNKVELNEAINTLAGDISNAKSVNLYEIQFNPVPLKKKVVLTV